MSLFDYVLMAVDRATALFDRRRQKRERLYTVFVGPFMTDAAIIIDDCFAFYHRYADAMDGAKRRAEALASDTPWSDRVDADLVTFLRAQRRELQERRERFVTGRIRLQKVAATLSELKSGDKDVDYYVSAMCHSVVRIFSEPENVTCSRPRALLDVIDDLVAVERGIHPKGGQYPWLGGARALIERSEREWALACRYHEVLKLFLLNGDEPFGFRVERLWDE